MWAAHISTVKPLDGFEEVASLFLILHAFVFAAFSHQTIPPFVSDVPGMIVYSVGMEDADSERKASEAIFHTASGNKMILQN